MKIPLLVFLYMIPIVLGFWAVEIFIYRATPPGAAVALILVGIYMYLIFKYIDRRYV